MVLVQDMYASTSAVRLLAERARQRRSRRALRLLLTLLLELQCCYMVEVVGCCYWWLYCFFSLHCF